MLTKNACAIAIAAVCALLASGAAAANVSASVAMLQSDGASWSQDLSSLVAIDAQSNFSMLQGPATYTGPGSPWQWQVQLKQFSGHGDPDMIYAVSAVNNSTLTQTYTFTFAEAIEPTVSGANSTYAELAGALTSRSGNVGGATLTPVNASGVQRFELSSDNGATFVNAGVDVGQTASFASGTNTYGLYTANNASGPVGQTWNYMRMVSSFTLSGKSAASLTGFASVTPVPEPQSGAMLLLGIGMIGTIVRRRRSVWL